MSASAFSAVLLFVGDGSDDLKVHSSVTDSRDLRGNACPMDESLAVPSEARPCCCPMGIVIGSAGISLDKLTRIVLAEPF